MVRWVRLPSRHRIRNLSPGGLRPSTAPHKFYVGPTLYKCYTNVLCLHRYGLRDKNEIIRALGHVCAHIGKIGPGESPEDGEMTLPSRRRIRNSSPGDGLRRAEHGRRIIRDAPFDICGGGGARVFVACKLFFLPPRENNLFFWRSTFDNFFFMFRPRNFLSYAFPIMYGTLPFGVFSGQHIFHQFRQQTFFSDFCGDKLFISVLI